MNTRLAIIFFVLLSLAATISSQRISRANTGPSWFPKREYSPDSPAYPLDRIGERLDLLFSSAGDERLDRCLEFADEKLAEALDMVRAQEAGYTWIAVGLHKDYLERGARELDAEPAASALSRRKRFLEFLTNHFTKVADEYPGLPDEMRAFSLIPLVSTVLLQFDKEVALLPKDEQGAFLQRRGIFEDMTLTMRELDR